MLNHCSHMDYFTEVFTTFLGRESANKVAVTCWFRKLPDFIKNILICVAKVRHESEQLMTEISLWVNLQYTFNFFCHLNFKKKTKNLLSDSVNFIRPCLQ